MAPTIIRQCVMMAQGPWSGSEGRPGPQQPEQLLSGDRAWGHRGGGRGGGALSTFPQSPRVREQSRASVSSPQHTALPRATCQALRWPLTWHLCEPALWLHCPPSVRCDLCQNPQETPDPFVTIPRIQSLSDCELAGSAAIISWLIGL